MLRLADAITRNENFKLFFDNYYTRSFDYRVETNSGTAATKWFDNKSAGIASSFIGAEPSDNCKRWDSKLRRFVDVYLPLYIAEYSKFMGGVDLS
ncbi:hypothetical protein QYM36_013696 [Artemia franciscana]|uniref:Uncharacterized protein n=1 Tax=Artemia franciscana TaxID=6661 RepID=A0AA88HN60_ARTSF|nr:hypothetical protein QYM36_013696 [Artemia franciscana]